MGFIPDALGTVGHTDGGDAEPLDGGGVEAVVLTGNECALFLKSHLLHKSFGPLAVFTGDEDLSL